MTGERGSTLVELLVVSGLLAFVVAVSLTILQATASRVPGELERADSIREAQVWLHRITRELRQAYAVNGSGFSHIDVNVRIGNANRRVRYDCGVPAPGGRFRNCVRYESAAGQALPASGQVAGERLLNGTGDEGGRVFFPDDPFAPRFVRVKLVVPAGGELQRGGFSHRIVLDDGVYLRNLNLG